MTLKIDWSLPVWFHGSGIWLHATDNALNEVQNHQWKYDPKIISNKTWRCKLCEVQLIEAILVGTNENRLLLGDYLTKCSDIAMKKACK